MSVLSCLYFKSWGGRVPIMVVLESWAYMGISILGCSLKRKCSLKISPFFLHLWPKESLSLRMYFRSSSRNSNVQTPKGPGLWLPVGVYALSATATDGSGNITKSFRKWAMEAEKVLALTSLICLGMSTCSMPVIVGTCVSTAAPFRG